MFGILGRSIRLTEDILQTVMSNVENIVNGRPMTKISTDIHDDVPLTANHSLLQHSNVSISWGTFFAGDQ